MYIEVFIVVMFLIAGSFTPDPGQCKAGSELGHPAYHLWVNHPRLHRVCVCQEQTAERPRLLPGGGPDPAPWKVVQRADQATRVPWWAAPEDHE